MSCYNSTIGPALVDKVWSRTVGFPQHVMARGFIERCEVISELPGTQIGQTRSE
jgi:hypothetical protein